MEKEARLIGLVMPGDERPEEQGCGHQGERSSENENGDRIQEQRGAGGAKEVPCPSPSHQGVGDKTSIEVEANLTLSQCQDGNNVRHP